MKKFIIISNYYLFNMSKINNIIFIRIKLKKQIKFFN